MNTFLRFRRKLNHQLSIFLKIRNITNASATESVKSEPGATSPPPTATTTSLAATSVNTGPFLTKQSKDPNLLNQSISFDDVPGPTTLKRISEMWSIIPMAASEVTVKLVQHLLKSTTSIGKTFGSKDKSTLFTKVFQTYGPVVRLHGPFGTDVVLLNKPEDATKALTEQDKSQVRCCLDSVEKYRLNCRKYKPSGPLFISANLEAIRKATLKSTTSLITTNQQIKNMESVCNEFVTRLKENRTKQEELATNLKIELYKCSLECLSFLAFNKKLGLLGGSTLNPLSEAGRLLEGLVGATDAVRKCEYGIHFWKFFETPAFRSLIKNCDLIDSVSNLEVDRAMSSLKERKDKNKGFTDISLVESLLLNQGISEEDVMTTLLDLFLIGANAISHTVCYLLYYLARNPRCQIKLHEEAVKYNENLNDTTIKKLVYCNACIKECLRLDPPIPIVNRILNKDIIINHYRIPKGTCVLFASHLNNTKEEYFEEPYRFKPERWMGDKIGNYGNECLTFASIPFGHGSQAANLRELANIQMILLIVKILRKFRIEYNYGDAKNVNEFLSSPTVPMRFRFMDRNH